MNESNELQKYRAVVDYLGTRYAGWQCQPDRTTVQSKIQEALGKLNREPVNVIASGRTDAGVHARGQVVHFRQKRRMEPKTLRRALNAMLPPDIRIRSAKMASPTFHAQKDAVRKRYEYRLFTGPVLSPFSSETVYHLLRQVSFERMTESAPLLEGTHDFSGFAASSSRVKNATRTIFLSRLRRRGNHLVYRVEGSGFLQHMVRNIVGTLIEIGRARRPVDDLTRVLESRDRRNAGPTAPPQGLCLMRVWYPRGGNPKSEARNPR